MLFTEPQSARILVIDDDEYVRRLLRRLLTPVGYAVEEAATAEEGLSRVRAEPPDLVLLDLHLPDRSGHDVLEAIRADPSTRLLPVVMLTGMATATEKMRAQAEGVTDFIAKPFSQEELLPRVRALVMLKLFADEHEHAEHVILTLAKTIDARDPYTAGHSGRVAEYADRIAHAHGPRRRRPQRHAPRRALPRPRQDRDSRRDPAEARRADARGAGHHRGAPGRRQRPALADEDDAARPSRSSTHHHERLDGSGYPEGISGSAIPMTVRIVTIADIFDALTTDRAYRGALRIDTAFEILAEGVHARAGGTATRSRC